MAKHLRCPFGCGKFRIFDEEEHIPWNVYRPRGCSVCQLDFLKYYDHLLPRCFYDWTTYDTYLERINCIDFLYNTLWICACHDHELKSELDLNTDHEIQIKPGTFSPLTFNDDRTGSPRFNRHCIRCRVLPCSRTGMAHIHPGLL